MKFFLSAFLVLALSNFGVEALSSGTDSIHQLAKRSPQPCYYPPCPDATPTLPPTPTSTDTSPTTSTPTPTSAITPTPTETTTPTPTTSATPDPAPTPGTDCTCPANGVIPSLNVLLANLNPSLGKVLLALLGDNAVVNGLNALLVQVIMILTGCKVTAPVGAGETGVAGLVNAISGA